MTSAFELCQYQLSYWFWAVSSCFMSAAWNDAKLSRLFTPAVTLFGSQNETSGAYMLNAGAAGAGHCALINTPLNRVVALKVKSTARPAFGLVNVAVTGLNVPIGNPGMVITAFVALTRE